MAFDVRAADWVDQMSDQAIRRVVDSGTLQRGRDYFDRAMVTSLGTADRGRVLVADVSGGRDAVYQTLVSRTGATTDPSWTGRCGCPVGVKCKHCVAVLLTAREAYRTTMSGHTGPAASDSVLRALWADDHEVARSGADPRRTVPGIAGTLPEPDWARVLDPLVTDPIDDEELPRTPLVVMVTPMSRSSAGTRERAFGLSLRPTRQSRTGTWTASWGWDQALGPLSARTMAPDHLALGLELCRIDQATSRYSFSNRPQTIDVAQLGPQLWPWLAMAVDAGVRFVPGPVAKAGARRPAPRSGGRRPVARRATTPAGDVSLPALSSVAVADEAVTPELDVTRRADGSLALGATLSGVPDGVSVHPLGSPVHGLAVVHGDVLTLAPVQPVLPTGFDVIFEGSAVIVPPHDVERFLAFYYPRLRRRMRVVSPDASIQLPEPEPVRAHLRVVPHTVGDLEVVASYAYPGTDGPTLVPVDALDRWHDRDVGAERQLVARADGLALVPGLRFAERTGGYRLQRSVHVRGLEAARFVRDVLPALEDDEDLVVAVDGELPTYEEATEAPLIEWQAAQTPLDGRPDNDWLDLHVTVSVGGEAVPFEPLLRALVAGDKVMLLESGTWFSLDDASLDRLRALIEEARELGDPVSDGVRVNRFQVDLFAELVELGVVDRESRAWAERLVAIRDGLTVADAEVPAGVKAELRPYQREGYQWLATLWDAGLGALLADDMGLGKTVQTLAVIQRAADRGDLTEPVLVVAPTSVLTTWSDEARRFTPGLRVVIVGETSRRRRRTLAEVVDSADVVVTSYAVFRIDAEAFRGLRWRALVLDEAQAVKNSSSQTYHAARRLPAPFRLVVTGTPLENSLMDLWSLLSIAAPGLYPRRDRFSDQYRKPVETGAEEGRERLARLRRRIRPLLLRRTKEEVAADLPPKQVQVLPVALHPVHQRIYDQHLQRERQRLLGLLDDPQANRVAILASLTRLRQLSLDPSLVDESYVGRAVSAKVTELIDHLTELRQEGHRALVFSQFTGYLRLVERQLGEAGIATSYLDGRTRHRGDVIEGFRSGDATAFLISLKAGGVGLTLTEADYVFVLDPWWNPATEAQAIDRAHRIGQTRPVMVYRMVSSGTVEDKVVALQDRKRDLFSRVVDGGEPLGGAITPEDIRALLAGDDDCDDRTDDDRDGRTADDRTDDDRTADDGAPAQPTMDTAQPWVTSEPSAPRR